ncbi:MAG: patatin-like phospholipase family protein [Deltaproteobacteria bacterium]|nr:patatin-like phospholipase family protein [Deltaproteobacteria bacterium]
MSRSLAYTSVVFAGGGNRCIWQAGFWEVVAPALQLEPKVVAGASAGAHTACVIFAGRSEFSKAYLNQITTDNRSNFRFSNLTKGKRPFPHYDMYRRSILTIFDEEAFSRLKRGPEIRVLLACPPRWAGSLGGVMLGFLSYAFEKRITAPLHPKLPAALGFRPEIVPVSTCRNPEELADLILASSCTPPVLPPMRRNGRPVLDGGLVDNVPVVAINPWELPTLVLLTRRYAPAKLHGYHGRTYVQPSEPVPVSKWDYTDPEGLEITYDLGRRDGERFLIDPRYSYR